MRREDDNKFVLFGIIDYKFLRQGKYDQQN